MYTSTLIYFALALTSNAIPLARPTSNTTVQRRSADYDVVNVGGIIDAAPSAVTTVIETVTAPGAPLQTTTVTVSPTPTSSPCSSALWATSTFASSSSAFPTVTPVPGETTAPSGFSAMDRLARALGRSIDSHLRTRDGDLTRDIKVRSNESTASSLLSARSVNGTQSVHLSRSTNGTERVHLPRGLVNTTGTASLKSRGLNSTILEV